MTLCVRCGRPVVQGVWLIDGELRGLCPIHAGYAEQSDIREALAEKEDTYED